MRSLWGKYFYILFLFAIGASAQVNPHTNIKWPGNCSGATPIYNTITNQCQASGTAANPAGNPGQSQFNLLGAFAGSGKLTFDNLGRPTLLGNVNTQLNVMNYGAVGDCVTDDEAAIALAQTAALAYTPAAALYFPKPPGGCYLLSTLPFYGVSMIGQPAGQGASQGGGPTQFGVTLKGKPGKDVLAAPDPNSTSFPWNKSWTIRDIALMVDGSAVQSYPHRWPGRWVDDVGATNGSNVITTANAKMSCGDIGQAIQINGAGPGGTNLVTTIANVTPCWAQAGDNWQVITIATNASTTVANAHTYISLLNLPVTATIGNCGLAFDDVDSNPAHWVNPSQSIGSLGAKLEDVAFVATGATTNNPCGLFVQGAWQPYQLSVLGSNFSFSTYGAVQAGSELNSFMSAGSSDFQRWEHNWFFVNKYPFIAYNGGKNKIDGWQIAAQSGPQILQFGNNSFDVADNWTINAPEFELVNSSTGFGWRIEGHNMRMRNVSLNGDASMTAYIDTQSSDCQGCTAVGGTVLLNGAGNKISDFGGDLAAVTVRDKGQNNRFFGSYFSNPFKGIPEAYPVAEVPHKGESQMVGRATADAYRDGNPAAPYNLNDLMFWPQDFLITTGPYSTYFTSNPASPGGADWTMPSGFFVSNFAQIPFTTLTGVSLQQQLLLGTNLPLGKYTVYYTAKCPNAVVSLTFSITQTGGANRAADTESCTTTFQNYSYTADLSAFTNGAAVGFENHGANAFTVNQIVMVPWVAAINGASMNGGAGARVKTNTSANSDWAGELSVSAATTVSYNWQNTYVSHPEVALTCQFDCHTNPPWVTYTGVTSFTINFSSAATGAVSYTTVGRD